MAPVAGTALRTGGVLVVVVCAGVALFSLALSALHRAVRDDVAAVAGAAAVSGAAAALDAAYLAPPACVCDPTTVAGMSPADAAAAAESTRATLWGLRYYADNDTSSWPHVLTRARVIDVLSTVGARVRQCKESKIAPGNAGTGAFRPPRGCVLRSFGQGWGAHELCELESPPSGRGCNFVSFGISSDYSFDTDLSRANCAGIALDPSVTHPSTIAPRVLFLGAAARTLSAASDFQWQMRTTVPGLRAWLGLAHVTVLKMDCEGCEYALAEDVAATAPNFFKTVDQFAFEVHLPRGFMSSWHHVHNLALLFLQLESAGLELAYARIDRCGPIDEAAGCHPDIVEAGFPCEPMGMCHNYLFARPRG